MRYKTKLQLLLEQKQLEANMPKAVFAKTLGISYQTYCSLTQSRHGPQYKTITRLSIALKMSEATIAKLANKITDIPCKETTQKGEKE